MLTSCLTAFMQVSFTISLHREVAFEVGFRMCLLPVTAGQKQVFQSDEKCSETHSSVTELLSPLTKSLGLHYQNTQRAVLQLPQCVLAFVGDVKDWSDLTINQYGP